jgi:MFS family permease
LKARAPPRYEGGLLMTRTERRYYVLTGGYNLAQFFIWPIYPLFLLGRGLDLFQINAVLATYGITIFLFDVPTGAIADVAGRRVSFVLGCVIRTGAYALYTLARGFQDCLVAEFLDAIGTTFVTGALDAWVVDGARAEGDERPMDRVFARGAVIARALVIAGGLAAGYLAEVSMLLPWLVAASLFAATAVAGSVLMRDRGAGPVRRGESITRTALSGIAIVRGSPVLLLLCGLSLASAFAAFPLSMLWAPRLTQLGAEHVRVMGWVVAFMSLASVVGSAALPRLLRSARREVVLCAAALWRAANVALLAAAPVLGPALGGLVLQEIGFGLSDPINTAWTNEHVAAAQRATVLSVRSMFVTLGASAGLITIGLIARGFGIPVALGVSAVLFALVAPGFVVLGRVARREQTAAVPLEAVAKVGGSHPSRDGSGAGSYPGHSVIGSRG